MSEQEKPVLVTGDFDDIRSRHIRLLQEAAKHGPLTILIWSDDAIVRRSGRPPKFPEAERLYLLRAIRYVSQAKLIRTDDELQSDLSALKANLWVVDSSQSDSETEKLCQLHGMKLRILAESELAGFPQMPMTKPPSARAKRVLVTGCYDWFHSGHVRFFEEAGSHGELYVVVGHDANIRLLKGEGRPVFGEEERRYIVGSVRFVHQAMISSGHGWLDAEPEMKKIQPHIYAVNEDGDVPEKREYCQAHGIDYLVLKRTPAPGMPKRSSTALRGF
jgi:cytidyltransferase-like protein